MEERRRRRMRQAERARRSAVYEGAGFLQWLSERIFSSREARDRPREVQCVV